MQELNCRSARRWLQAPHELWRGDMRTLDTHLAACAACRALSVRQGEMDRRLRQSLQAVHADGSIRAQVMATIAPTTTRGAARWSRRSSGRGIRRMFFWPSGVAVSVALAATVLAFLAPQFVPQAGVRVPSVGAASHLVRKEIGYPFALDPMRRDHLLAGARGQIYQSWNAGANWKPLRPLPPGLIIRALVIDATRPTRYLVAAKHSVFVSEDAGQHWRRTAANLHGAENMFIVQDAVSPRVFYLGPSTVWKSMDGGLTWRHAGRGAIFAPYGIQALQAAPTGLLYTGIWGGGVATSTNGGHTWQRRARGLARNVMDVARSAQGVLWAASDRGVYQSLNGGGRWQRLGPPFFATSVLPGAGYVLAGGDRTLYRSTDGGRNWQFAMNGLPLGPSINSLVADPHHPGRVYASLNSDGIFRSDDAGRHWSAMNAGLPLSLEIGSARALLFLRHGALWITDVSGADPGVLTVERDVTMAVLAPDGAAVAYVRGSAASWAVRVVGAGGSMPLTLASGSGTPPAALKWSTNSSLLAIDGRSTVHVHDLSSEYWSWNVPAGQRLLGWAPGGRNLLFWDRSTGRIVARRWNTGAEWAYGHSIVGVRPVLSSDGTRLLAVARGTLLTGVLPGPMRRVSAVDRRCRPLSWASDDRSFFLACDQTIEQRTSTGTLLHQIRLRAGTVVAATPDGTVLLFRRGTLWSWTTAGTLKKLVRGAAPAAPQVVTTAP